MLLQTLLVRFRSRAKIRRPRRNPRCFSGQCTRQRNRFAGHIEALEQRIVLSADVLASAVDVVSFATAEQSMWGPDGPAVQDTGLLFAGTSWNAGIDPILGSAALNNYIQIDASTSGKIGVDFQAILDPGSIDASFASQAALEVIAGAAENSFTIISQTLAAPVGSLITRSPNIDVESNFIFELAAGLRLEGEFGTPDLTLTVPTIRFEKRCIDLGIFGTACVQVPIFGTKQLTIAGLSFPFEQQIVSLDIANSLELLKITNHQIRILEQDLAVAESGENLSFTFDLAFDPLGGIDIEEVDADNPKKDEKPHNTNPFDVGVALSMGDVTVEVPTLNLEQNQFTTVGGDTGLRMSGAADLARLDLDADFLASVMFGLPPLGASVEFALGPVDLFEFSYDLLDVDLGPQFSIGQDFEFLPELWVDLTFSEPITIGGQQVSRHSMPVGSSLDATFDGAAAGADLDIQTQYVLRNQFRNTTELLLAPQVDALVLGATVDTFLGTIFDGALYDPAPIQGDAGTLATIFDDSFSLGGFNTVAGELLHVEFNKAPEIHSEDLVINATIDEGSPLSLSGSFVDPNAGQTHTVSIDWGDGSEPTVLELAADVFSFGSVEHIYADGAANHDISVTVTDNKDESDGTLASVEVLNVAPTLSVTGANSVDEGSLYTLDLSASDPGNDAIQGWTIDWGDGNIESIAGNPSSVTHIYADGASAPTVLATATDEDGTFAAMPWNVIIDNVAPTVGLTGSSWNLDENASPIPFSGVQGQTLSFSGSLSDPGFDNLAANPNTFETFTYSIEFGDASTTGPLAVTEATSGSSGIPTIGTFSVEHVYTAAGTYLLTLTVTDDDGGSTELVQTVTIADKSLQIGGDLAIGGTLANDHLKLNQDTGGSAVEAQLSNAAAVSFPAVNRILVYLQDGDDRAQASGSLSIPLWIFGGPGNDHIKGGGADDVLDGGTGDDLIVGGNGRDLIIGGSDSDRLVGNADDDILVAGWLNFHNPIGALERIMAEWTSHHDLATRVAHLSGMPGGVNDDAFLKVGETLETSDGARDVVTGSSGDDWFFFDSDLDNDKATDLKDEVFANDLDFILGMSG